MVARPTIALIVPTYNMAGHLEPLWASFKAAGLLETLTEIIFVDDGSTDETPHQLQQLATQHDHVAVVTLPENQGRFCARQQGAVRATSERLLFIDSRITVPSGFADALQQVAQTASNVVGCIDIDTTLNIYCLYWQRTHEFIFWRHYRDTQVPLLLTPANYDQYLKGTTLFLCSRNLFITSCNAFGDTVPLNDDTTLMRLMVEHEPLVVHPALRGNWVPRGTLLAFLERLWERGPQFAEYHLFQRQGFFFWAVVLGLLIAAGLLWLSLLDPQHGLTLWAGILVLVTLSTTLLSKSFREFFLLAPLHVTVVFTCGLSVVRGILYHCWPFTRFRANRGSFTNQAT